MCLSHIEASFSLSFPFPSLKSISMSSGEKKKTGGKGSVDHCAPHRRRQRQCPSPPGAVKTAGQSPWTSPSLGKCTLLIPLPTGMILSFISRGHWRDIAGGWRGSFWSCWPDSCSEVSSFHSYPAPGVNRGTHRPMLLPAHLYGSLVNVPPERYLPLGQLSLVPGRHICSKVRPQGPTATHQPFWEPWPHSLSEVWGSALERQALP